MPPNVSSGRYSRILPIFALLALASACAPSEDGRVSPEAWAELQAQRALAVANPPECLDRMCVFNTDCIYGAGGPNPINCGSCQSNNYCSLSGHPVTATTDGTYTADAGAANPPECLDRQCVRDTDCIYGAGGPNPINCGTCQSNNYCSLSGHPDTTTYDAGTDTYDAGTTSANPPECMGRQCVRDTDCVYGAGGPNPISCGTCQSNNYCSLSGYSTTTTTSYDAGTTYDAGTVAANPPECLNRMCVYDRDCIYGAGGPNPINCGTCQANSYCSLSGR